MKHELVFLGKTKDKFIQAGIDEYYSRLKHYTNAVISTLKERSSKGGKDAIVNQGEMLLGSVPQGALIVALDSRGQQFSSVDFSKKISEWELKGTKQVSYLIGGPEGISEEVLQRAGLILSFSKMTFTHDMVRMLLVEQLYRAYTIKNGEKYHK